MFCLVCWNADACILHRKAYDIICYFRLEGDAALMCKLHRILEQMSKNTRGVHFVCKQCDGICLRIVQYLECYFSVFILRTSIEVDGRMVDSQRHNRLNADLVIAFNLHLTTDIA